MLEFEDIFKLIDLDGSGEINQYEFKTFAGRLGMTFSDHKITEIFSSVKRRIGRDTMSNDGEITINLEEFKLALMYL